MTIEGVLAPKQDYQPLLMALLLDGPKQATWSETSGEASCSLATTGFKHGSSE